MITFSVQYLDKTLVSVAARFEAWVCGRSPAGVVGSNPTGEEWMSVVSVVCCQVEVFVTS